MMGWYYFPKSSPRPVKDGIRTKSKRGSIGEKWWSKRFIEALHRMGMDSRLARGRTYARKGQVTRISIQKGVVHASVQGSQARPYQVSIALRPWDEKQWKTVITAIANQALYAARLLSGEIPHEIEEIVDKTGTHLFPDSKHDLKTDCDCPDYANPCKHIAAVYYILAERFDEDPFLIFAMRGKNKEQLLEELRNERGTSEEEPVAESASMSPDLPVPRTAAGFYGLNASLDDFQVHPTAHPEVAGALLRRLGPSPLFIGKKNFSDLIVQVYEFAPSYVRSMIHGEEEGEETKTRKIQ